MNGQSVNFDTAGWVVKTKYLSSRVPGEHVAPGDQGLVLAAAPRTGRLRRLRPFGNGPRHCERPVSHCAPQSFSPGRP